MATRRIKFIGKTPYKKDNVCHTNLYWPYRGAIQECQEEIAIRLLSHPDVWVEASKDDPGDPIVETLSEKLTSNLSREDKIRTAIEIIETEGCLIEIMAHFDPDFEDQSSGNGVGQCSDIDGQSSSADGSSGNGESRGPVVDDEDQGPAVTSNSTTQAVVDAINKLDRDNEDHFTQNDIPRVEAIEAVLGYDITAQQRTEAWDEIQAGEGN